MPRVRFTASAKADLDDALAWYDAHAPEIVAQFQQAIRSVVTRIEQNPLQFPPSSYGTRKALLPRFPYLVIFRVTDDACFVVALFHTSRDPSITERR